MLIMANSFFKFKEFVIEQDKCAMKVTTDACLFGAWCSNIVKQFSIKNILDIGAGTGLLSLMMAQQNNVEIYAVEIDKNAALQAQQNFTKSNWSNRLKIECNNIKNFQPQKQFDCIISNPPFFSGNLLSIKDERNVALHSTELSLQQLLLCINQLLTSNGIVCLLLPFNRLSEIETLTDNLHIVAKTLVKQTPKHDYFRAMLILSQKKITISTENEIVIKDETNNYSRSFIKLLSPYYLYL